MDLMIVRKLCRDLPHGSSSRTLRVPQSKKEHMAADPRRARAEADAAALLYTHHYQRVYGYCLYKLGNREEAEDAAQTAFLHALRGLRRGVVPVAEANWLLTIAKNVCLAGYRTNGRRRRLEVLSDPQALADVPGVREEAGESLLGLEAALARIPEQQRRAILLREWRGLPYREIAEEMGLTLAAVETLIFRARRSLAEILGEERGPRRRLAGFFDLGGLATVAKSLLGGASTVKVAAGVVAVTASLAVGPAVAPGDGLRPATPAVPPPVQAVPPAPAARPDPPSARPLAARGADERKSTARPDRSKPRPAPRSEATSKPPQAAAAAEKAPGPEAPVKTVTPPVGEVVGTTNATLDDAVETVSGTVDGVVEETGLPLPQVGAVTDELLDDVDAIVDVLPPLP
jgi:RNA polymerase sigma-70 factor, ECF subfamily